MTHTESVAEHPYQQKLASNGKRSSYIDSPTRSDFANISRLYKTSFDNAEMASLSSRALLGLLEQRKQHARARSAEEAVTFQQYCLGHTVSLLSLGSTDRTSDNHVHESDVRERLRFSEGLAWSVGIQGAHVDQASSGMSLYGSWGCTACQKRCSLA